MRRSRTRQQPGELFSQTRRARSSLRRALLAAAPGVLCADTSRNMAKGIDIVNVNRLSLHKAGVPTCRLRKLGGVSGEVRKVPEEGPPLPSDRHALSNEVPAFKPARIPPGWSFGSGEGPPPSLPELPQSVRGTGPCLIRSSEQTPLTFPANMQGSWSILSCRRGAYSDPSVPARPCQEASRAANEHPQLCGARSV